MDDLTTDLPQPIVVSVRVDGTVVAQISTARIGEKVAFLPVEQVPLTQHSFLELDILNGDQRLIVPGYVTHVGDNEVTIEYEQTDATFIKWRKSQMKDRSCSELSVPGNDLP
ncbi:MAG: hypothetical protein WBD51_10720 [Burkholderiaceae bacterium]